MNIDIDDESSQSELISSCIFRSVLLVISTRHYTVQVVFQGFKFCGRAITQERKICGAYE